MAKSGAKTSNKSIISDTALVQVARIVTQHFENNRSWYDTVGLLRIAEQEATLVKLSEYLTTHAHDPKSISKLLSKNSLDSKALTAHSYVGVLKRLVKNQGPHHISQHPGWAMLKSAFESNNQTLFAHGLSQLLNSPSQQDRNVAESVYHLLYTATQTAAHHVTNLMNDENCAVVVNPTLDAILFADNQDPVAMASRVGDIKEFTRQLINSNTYSLPFAEGVEYLGLSIETLEQLAEENKKLQVLFTEKMRVEMTAEAPNVARIERLRESIDRCNTTERKLAKLLEKNTVRHFSRMKSVDQRDFLNQLLSLTDENSVAAELVISNSADLRDMHTMLNQYPITVARDRLDDIVFQTYQTKKCGVSESGMPSCSSSTTKAKVSG